MHGTTGRPARGQCQPVSTRSTDRQWPQREFAASRQRTPPQELGEHPLRSDQCRARGLKFLGDLDRRAMMRIVAVAQRDQRGSIEEHPLSHATDPHGASRHSDASPCGSSASAPSSPIASVCHRCSGRARQRDRGYPSRPPVHRDDPQGQPLRWTGLCQRGACHLVVLREPCGARAPPGPRCRWEAPRRAQGRCGHFERNHGRS